MFVISELDAAVMLMEEDGWLHSTAAAASPSHDAENHRITESQNSRGWKGPLWVI